MKVPLEVRAGVEAALSERAGRPARLARVSPVGGGCISPSVRAETEAGDVAFLKWGEPGRTPPGMFSAEARSLGALAEAGAVRVPAVLGVYDPAAGAVPGGDTPPAWLLLEWLEPGRAAPATWASLGRELAELHRSRAALYGWSEDNFIGPLPQANGALPDWPRFWRERRLEPQLRRAYDAGWFDDGARRRFGRLLDGLDELLRPAAEDGASLLHGDLWSGNVHPLADGGAALVDPASYHGHREADLAMTELFGGFGPAFYGAYGESWPLLPGYRRARRPVYQLYYLLVHVNLFGAGYLGRTLDALSEAGY